jgi:hypothetical protein
MEGILPVGSEKAGDSKRKRKRKRKSAKKENEHQTEGADT